MIWKTRRISLDFNDKDLHEGVVMAILNATPDSFSDGGQHDDHSKAVAAGQQMISDGAKIIDIGGESTRPGAPSVSAEQEIFRTEPLVRALRAESEVLISIDTSKASVATAAINAGADIVNDVTGLTGDSAMVEVCAEAGVGVVVMHMQGTPRTMQQNPTYPNGVVTEVADFFKQRLDTLTAAGIDLENIILDPGIGFGKTLDQNLELLRNLGTLQRQLGRPLLLGVSRKSFIGKITGIENAAERDSATAALTAMACQQGILLHRVHHVPANLHAMQLAAAIQQV
ncbi:dihydropteroate synthase [Oceaniferula spumae]|uniref:Dihydropteroate synthase n=1 Tax=Oceaniferula spumae TaxID=2979115 RepID=A0AAT9FQK4_9BACT